MAIDEARLPGEKSETGGVKLVPSETPVQPKDASPQLTSIDVTNANAVVFKRIEDALYLLQYAIASAAKDKDDKAELSPAVSKDVVRTILTTASRLGMFSKPDGFYSITIDEWTDFELAYYELALAMSPVTAETLQSTEGTSSSNIDAEQALSGRFALKQRRGRVQTALDYLLGFSPAQRFTRGLWLVAICFGAFVVLVDWRINRLGLEADVDRARLKPLLELMIPWAYGGLGSCAFLLRSAHAYIYQRNFDLRRKPEYFNRILLGAISGGAIILFTKYLIDQEGEVVQLSAAALGFIAGYSTDFLFNTIERIVNAIFPKVTVENVPKDSSK